MCCVFQIIDFPSDALQKRARKRKRERENKKEMLENEKIFPPSFLKFFFLSERVCLYIFYMKITLKSAEGRQKSAASIYLLLQNFTFYIHTLNMMLACVSVEGKVCS